MLEKFAEGYNDMYFVDDALSNVKAVKKVLDQLDIKSNVQQARASKDINQDFNKMIDLMSQQVFIDGRNQFSKDQIESKGFEYFQIGVK